MLSAQQEELRSALNRELGRHSPRQKVIQGHFQSKQRLDAELEALGYGEHQPFPMADIPLAGRVPLLVADRQKALQARAIQLDAWLDTVRDDQRLLRRAMEKGALDAATGHSQSRELEALVKRINGMIRDNELKSSSKN